MGTILDIVGMVHSPLSMVIKAPLYKSSLEFCLRLHSRVSEHRINHHIIKLNRSFLESLLEVYSLTISWISILSIPSCYTCNILKLFRGLLCIVNLIFVFKRFNAENVRSEMSFVSGVPEIKFISLKVLAKIELIN